MRYAFYNSQVKSVIVIAYSVNMAAADSYNSKGDVVRISIYYLNASNVYVILYRKKLCMIFNVEVTLLVNVILQKPLLFPPVQLYP